MTDQILFDLCAYSDCSGIRVHIVMRMQGTRVLGFVL